MAKSKNKPSEEKAEKPKKLGRPKKSVVEKTEQPIAEEPISNEPPLGEPSVEAAEPSVEQIEEKIYGDEPKKEFVPFPKSDLQTRSKTVITEFGIDVSRLPKNILDAVNDMVTDFSTFVTNPNMFNMVSVIMEKDTTAYNLLLEWLESRKELLLSIKKEEEKQQPPQPLHQQTGFTPQTSTTPVVKKEVIIDKEQVHRDYALSIFNLIFGCFQMCHWGYIPLSELQKLIANCDKQYNYEIVNNGAESCVIVSTTELTVKTNNFKIG